MASVPLHASLLSVLFVVDVLATAALWRFRKERTLVLRSVPAMLSIVWLSFLSALSDNMGAIYADFGIQNGTCWQFRIKLVYEHQAVVTMLFSAYRVLFFMELASHLAKTQDAQNRANLLAGRGGWYVKHRHWMDWKYSRWFFLSQGLLMLAFVLGFSAIDSGCAKLSAFRFLSGIVSLIYLGCVIYLMYRLSKWGRDAFGIKVDLARMAVCGVILKVVNIVLFLNDGEGVTQQAGEGIIQFFLAMCMSIFLVLSPAIRVLRSRETFTEPTTLEDLVKRPTGYESFLEFLNSEFASESLHFWNNVNLYRARFRSLADTKARLDYASEMSETFIRPGAILEVNLGSVTRGKIADILAASQKDFEEGQEHPELITVFDGAQSEILKLMSRDSFRRYLKSPQFALWKARAASQGSEQHSNPSEEPSSSTNTGSRGPNMLSLTVSKVSQDHELPRGSVDSNAARNTPIRPSSSVVIAPQPAVQLPENSNIELWFYDAGL